MRELKHEICARPVVVAQYMQESKERRNAGKKKKVSWKKAG